MNPVVAGLVENSAVWLWSSTQAHLAAMNDELVTIAPLLEMAGDWRLFLAGAGEERYKRNQKTRTDGQTAWPEGFVERLETALESPLKLGKPGPKRKNS